MNILSLPAPPSNAGAADAVRTQPDDEFTVGEFTEEKFEAWLDSHPGRRRNHNAEGPKEQARERQRLARLFALRASPMPADLLAAVTLARELRAMLRQIVARYAPMEAGRVLEEAGLALPKHTDICQAWAADTFATPRRECKRLGRELGEFEAIVWAVIQHLVPKADRPTDEPATVEGGAK